MAVRVDQQLGQGVDLTMTGHSLGGGLASAASMATGRSAVTFNPAELNCMWATQRGFPGRKTVSYSVAGEVLTGAQDFSLLLVPAWQRFELEPAKDDAGADPVTLHKMPAVLHALELPVPGL